MMNIAVASAINNMNIANAAHAARTASTSTTGGVAEVLVVIGLAVVGMALGSLLSKWANR